MNYHDQEITQGDLQTPYQEITYTIPANGRDRANIDFRYFRLISLTGSGLRLRFGHSGSFTSIVGAGIGIELQQAVSLVEFENTSGGSITFTIGVSMGRINDDRLNTVGNLSIASSTTSPLFTKNAGTVFSAQPDIVITASNSFVGGGNTANRAYILKNPITNAGSVRIGTGALAGQGFELGIGESIVLELTSNLVIFNPNAVSVTLSLTILRD